MNSARQIIEAETPKGVFRSVATPGSTFTLQGFTEGPAGTFKKNLPTGQIWIVRGDPKQGHRFDWNLYVGKNNGAGLAPSAIENTYWNADHWDMLLRTVEKYSQMLSEAEDPKAAFRSLPRLEPWLKANRFEHHGAAGWRRKTSPYALEDRQKTNINVWKDSETGTWIVKREGQKRHFGKWCGWHDLGFREFQTEQETLAYLLTMDLP